MSSRTPDLLSNIFANGLQPRAATIPRGMIPMKSRGSGEASGEAFVPPASRRRTAIWDMHHSMHCSIIGTCLSTTEIRRLLIKLDLQQRQLRDGFVERDHKIRLLNEVLSRALAQAPACEAHADDDVRAAEAALIDVDRRLDREVTRRKRLESRLEAATLAASQAEHVRQEAEGECERLHRELSLVEAQIAGWLGEEQSALAPQLGGGQVLYVGGRAQSTCPPPSCGARDRKSTRLNSSHANISYAVFCLKKKKRTISGIFSSTVVAIMNTTCADGSSMDLSRPLNELP